MLWFSGKRECAALLGLLLFLVCCSSSEDSSTIQKDNSVVADQLLSGVGVEPGQAQMGQRPEEVEKLNAKLFREMENLNGQQRLDRLKRLLQAGASPNAIDATGEPILVLAAGLGGCEDVLLLLEHGADIDAQDAIGITALIGCFYTIDRLPTGDDPTGYFQKRCVMKLLLERGANINHRTKLGYTPLYIAIEANNVDAARLLLEHGADPDVSSITELWAPDGVTISAREAAAKMGSKEMQELFAQYPPPEAGAAAF